MMSDDSDDDEFGLDSAMIGSIDVENTDSNNNSNNQAKLETGFS